MKPDSITILNEKECIIRVIKADDFRGVIGNHACEVETLSMSIKNYVSSIAALNFKNCPLDFEKAFNTHIKARIAMLTIINNYPAMRGEMYDLFDQLEKRRNSAAFKKHLKNIWDTWADIVKIVKSYETIPQ